MNFYALIIGTEILNGRRIDKHFDFLRKELQKYGHELYASFIIKDDKELIKNTFNLIKSDKDSIMFSFGGIGATPDDLTRAIAAEVFTSKALVRHKNFEKDIIDKFAHEAYPHRIHMSDLPQGSELLFNPINNMSGFYLQKRFFFVPGFPQMAHPMINTIIKEFFPSSATTFRYTLLAYTSENSLISLMQKIPSYIELSSLPIFKNSIASVELSLSSDNKKEVENYFELFIKELQEKYITYELI